MGMNIAMLESITHHMTTHKNQLHNGQFHDMLYCMLTYKHLPTIIISLSWRFKLYFQLPEIRIVILVSIPTLLSQSNLL